MSLPKLTIGDCTMTFRTSSPLQTYQGMKKKAEGERERKKKSDYSIHRRAVSLGYYTFAAFSLVYLRVIYECCELNLSLLLLLLLLASPRAAACLPFPFRLYFVGLVRAQPTRVLACLHPIQNHPRGRLGCFLLLFSPLFFFILLLLSAPTS